MTQITTHHPRSGWKEDEARLLFDTVRAAAEDGRSLREVFQEVGGQLQRKPNSIRNYYYARVRETPDLSPRPTPFRAFTPEELHTLLREVLMGRGQGESVRACVTRLSGGDRSQMLRMQNKYRSILKNRPELLMEAAEELRQEGLPCPEKVVVFRRYGQPVPGNGELGALNRHQSDPEVRRMLDALNHLLEQRDSAPSPAPASEGARLHAKWLEARQEADRLKVEVDLLKMALEDERSARSTPAE